MGTAELVTSLRRRGLPVTGVVGAGMEGTVLALDDGTVAKVWRSRTRTDLERLRRFTAAVASGGAPFAVPHLLDLLEVDGLVVTISPHLPGVPLWDRPGVSPPPASLSAVADVLAEVLVGLGSVAVVPELAVLPVFEGEAPFAFGTPFGASLADLVESRATSVLDPSLVARVAAALRGLAPAPVSLLHGDLVPGNVLVSGGRVSAVLDFGFLSTVGDPAFDTAVTASVADMYGDHARRSEAVLDELLRDALGHTPERVALYRLAYALVTATCYSASGSDGHFAWCAAILARPDLLEAADV